MTAKEYAAKAAEAAGNKEDYTSISDAFNEGFTTFDTFQDGWVSDAFNAGASWGDGVADAVSNFSLSDVFGGTDIPNVSDYTSGFNDAIASSGVGDNLGDIAGDTGAIKDSMDITQEDLKYLRDIAEQDPLPRCYAFFRRSPHTSMDRRGASDTSKIPALSHQAYHNKTQSSP